MKESHSAEVGSGNEVEELRTELRREQEQRRRAEADFEVPPKTLLTEPI